MEKHSTGEKHSAGEKYSTGEKYSECNGDIKRGKDPPNVFNGSWQLPDQWLNEHIDFISQDSNECVEEDYQDVGSDDEGGKSDSMHYNPYGHIRFASDEARVMTRQYSIQEQCKTHFPKTDDQTIIHHAEKSLEDVQDAIQMIKCSSTNPLKLFAYCFAVRSQMSSKQVLQLLRLPLTKSGKQFSILSRGRQLYQQYRFNKDRGITNTPVDPQPAESVLQIQLKHELSQMHVNCDIFMGHTIDVINKLVQILIEQQQDDESGVVKCQKKYKVIIQRIKDLEDSNSMYSLTKQIAQKIDIVVRNRASKR